MQALAAEQLILSVENKFIVNSVLNARILGNCMLTMTRIGQCLFWLDSEMHRIVPISLDGVWCVWVGGLVFFLFWYLYQEITVPCGEWT